MRCSVHRHLNQWQKFQAWCFNTLNKIFNKWPGYTSHPLSAKVQALQAKLRSYLIWMAHNKMQSYLRKLDKWVTALTFAKAKVLTPRSYQQSRGGCRNWGHTGISSLLSKDRSSLQQAEVPKNTEGKTVTPQHKDKKCKGLDIVSMLHSAPLFTQNLGETQCSCAAQASRLIQFKKQLSQAHANIDLLSHPQLSAFKHLQENLRACKAFIACHWQESW